jgi:MFS family permease
MNIKLVRFYLTIIPCCALVILWGFSIAGDIPHFFLHTSDYHFSNAYFRPLAFFSNIFGLLIAGWLCDQYGRKRILNYATLLLCLLLLTVILFESKLNVFVMRIIINFFIGVIYVACLTYIIELAPTNHRGRAVMIMRLFIALGTLLAYFLDYIVIYSYHGHANIKVIVVFSFLLVFWLLFQFTPESFRWLSNREHIEQALIIFDRYNTDSKQTALEIAYFTSSKNKQYTWLDCIKNSPLRNGLLLVSLILIIITFAQVTSIIQFAPFILEKSGVQLALNNILLSLLLALVYFFSVSTSFFLVDKIGRQQLIIFGIGGMIISYVFINILINLFLGDKFEYILLITRPFLIVGFFGFGASGVLNLFSGEFFATSIRARAIAITTALLLISVAFNKLIFFYLINHLGFNGFFSITSIFAIVALILIAEFIPETNHQILESIEV